MNKLRISIVTLLLTVLLTSCSESKLVISSNEELKKVKELTIDQFGADLEVYKLSLSSNEELSNYLGQLEVAYFKQDGEKYSNQYSVNVIGNQPNLRGEEMHKSISKFKSKFDKPESYGKVKVKDIDFNRVIKDIDTALKEIKDIGNWYIEKYTFNVSPDNNSITSSFVLQVTPSEGATNLEGKRIVTNYYEYTCEIDSKGKLTWKQSY